MSHGTIGERRPDDLTSVRKAAILLLTMPEEEGVEILQTLEEDELLAIARETAYLKQIPEEWVRQVKAEFLEACQRRKLRLGGVERFKKLVGEATGELPTISGEPGAFVSRLDPSLLANVLRGEHPQTMAVVLSSIASAERAKNAIALLPPAVQGDVIVRMATLGKVKPEVIRQIEEVVREQVVTDSRGTRLEAGGVDMVAAALNHLEHETRERLVTSIQGEDPDLAELIRSKMFTFQDLAKLGDRAMQVLLREIRAEDLASALKASSDDFREIVYRNMSERAGAILKENIESMGPTKLTEVQAAQVRIAMTAKKLADEGKILLKQDNEKYV